MILLKFPPALENFIIACFIGSAILIIWAAIVWSDDLSKRVGEPTLKEWLVNLWRNRHNP